MRLFKNFSMLEICIILIVELCLELVDYRFISDKIIIYIVSM